MAHIPKSAKLLFAVFLMIVILIPSCKKKEIQGPKGEPGTPGGGGNSSMETMNAFTIYSSQWNKTADSVSWHTTINSSLITKEVADKGAVKIFMLLQSSWYTLPYNDHDHFMQFSFKEGSVTLLLSDMHGSLPPKPSATDFRLVVYSEEK